MVVGGSHLQIDLLLLKDAYVSVHTKRDRVHSLDIIPIACRRVRRAVPMESDTNQKGNPFA